MRGIIIFLMIPFGLIMGAIIGHSTGALIGLLIGVLNFILYLSDKHKKKVATKKQVNDLHGREMECTCEACGHFWCYGVDEIRTKSYQYADKCPQCGSHRIKKQLQSVHETA